MRTLRRYILSEFLTPVIYCLLAFSALYVVIELFGEFDKIVAAKPPARLLLRYLGGFLAKDLQWLVTPSLLLGGLYAMWQLARHGELTAMRASGVSFATITSPMVGASFAFAALIAASSEWYAPEASRDAARIKAAAFHGIGATSYEDVPYSNFRDRRDWQIGAFIPSSNTVMDVKVTWSNADGKPLATLDASRGVFSDGAWIFEDASYKRFEISEGTGAQVQISSDEREIMVVPEITESPRDFMLGIVQGGVLEDSVEMSYGDMRRYIEARPNLAPAARTSWRYEMANRFAAPFACVVITLFAIPAGVATGRQSVFIGVVSAILMFLVFYVLTITCGVFAKKGVIPVWAGIVAPNAVFLAAGLSMFHRQR